MKNRNLSLSVNDESADMNETKIENNNKLQDEEYEINHIDSWYTENSSVENSNSEINDIMDHIKEQRNSEKKIFLVS